ncbi:hypothetical protein [Diaminobutyricibacter sp. McL0608]|uniref:hypothetical protein n=1 Tax=Leifsonia sp. McL0608 TaxID=3143537 RepID=UPI0031F32AB4
MAFDASPLAQHLLHVATKHALEVLTCDQGTADEFARLVAAEHAGACVELSSKSILASHHPTLVLDGQFNAKHWESVMDPNQSPKGLKDIRTLDAGASATKACLLLGVDVKDSAKQLLAARNAAVHMGIAPYSIVDTVGRLTSWLRALIAAGIDLPAEVLTKQELSLQEMKSRVELRITMARLHTRNTPDPDLLSTFSELENHYDEVDQVVCPACGNAARLFQNLVDVEHYYSGGEELLDPVWEWDLRCPFCRLELSDGEIEAADIKIVDFNRDE